MQPTANQISIKTQALKKYVDLMNSSSSAKVCRVHKDMPCNLCSISSAVVNAVDAWIVTWWVYLKQKPELECSYGRPFAGTCKQYFNHSCTKAYLFPLQSHPDRPLPAWQGQDISSVNAFFGRIQRKIQSTCHSLGWIRRGEYISKES